MPELLQSVYNKQTRQYDARAQGMHGVELYKSTFIFYYFYPLIEVSGISFTRTEQSKQFKKIKKSLF